MLRSLALLLAALLLSLTAAVVPASAATRKPPCTEARARSRSRRASGCVPSSRRGAGAARPFGQLDGIEYEFDGIQLSGTLTARAPDDADFRFEAVTTAVVSPKQRTEQGPIFRRELSEVGGRFLLHGEYVLTAVKPVTWRTTSSARYEDNGEVTDCSYARPFAVNDLKLMIYPKRDRIAIRYGLMTPGWGCRHETTHYPSCGNGQLFDADVMFYKEIEFTRRWIKLPIDMQWRLSDTVDCEIRWNGFVRLKKLRDGK
ncbi:MAG TPA: hypothetical protein VLK58_19690 [Conexibacter sp.]|nr:hypothetical protein [Conexibacter sp.]